MLCPLRMVADDERYTGSSVCPAGNESGNFSGTDCDKPSATRSYNAAVTTYS